MRRPWAVLTCGRETSARIKAEESAKYARIRVRKFPAPFGTSL
jgi:hypothetical protein